MDTVLNKPLTKKDLDKLIKNVKNIQYEQPYWVIIKAKDEDKYLLVNNYASPYSISDLRRYI